LIYLQPQISGIMPKLCFFFVFIYGTNAFSNGDANHWYLQWGWNREAYSKSTIHFTNGSQYDFYWMNVSAKDKPDFQAILSEEVTIPQFSFRIGYRISPQWYLELNHDHAKYVVTPGQVMHVKGNMREVSVDQDTVFSNNQFHFEHTNGANFWMLMAARRYYSPWLNSHLSFFTKAGAGIVYPRTDVTLFGTRLNNRFHVAGYIVGTEASARCNIWQGSYVDFATKGGFANYINALTVEGGKAGHAFWFIEGIFSLGWEF
jgi:hypothetical protein